LFDSLVEAEGGGREVQGVGTPGKSVRKQIADTSRVRVQSGEEQNAAGQNSSGADDKTLHAV
jgi:hypothetical protein